MSELEIAGYEGPRTPRPDELPAVLELSRSIFFKDVPSYHEAAKRWPMALHEDFKKDCYSMFLNGQPVSTICRLERDILVHGHKLRIGFIGGVCTHPDHRGKGLASAILQACLAKFRENGVDFVYISGTRPLYYGIGANHIGGFTNFTVRATDIATYNRPDVTLRDAMIADADLLAQLNEGEALRVLRPISDYELSLTCGHCSGKACAFRVIQLSGKPVGYLIAGRPSEKEPGTIRLFEYAGDRFSLLAVLPRLAGEINGAVSLTVPVKDPLGLLMTAAGLAGQPGRTSGTVKLLDFDRTMRKLLPHFAAHLPAGLVRSLSFSCAEGKYVAWSDREILEIEGETNMLRVILGCPPTESVTGLRASATMRLLLDHCLPLPLPPLVMNMI